MTDYCTHTFRKIISTYKWANGSTIRSYRLRCKCCGYRWSLHYDTVLKQEVQVSKMSDHRPLNQKRFTPTEVRTILTDSRSGAELAEFFGVTHQSISQVRTGKSYSDLWPELPRRGTPSAKPEPVKKEVMESKLLNCRTCTHWWQKRCSLDVPEAGGTFAEDCSFYQVDD